MKATIAICTWNRAASLGRTLESLARLDVPPGLGWEVLVVDNNSTDDTGSVAAAFNGILPVRRIVATEQGLSHARNAAVQHARGEYIIWTDDDVVVAPEWLAAYCAAFEEKPEAAVFGGPVVPKFDEPPPGWLARGWPAVAGAFASIDLGPKPVRLSSDRLPYGANFVTRRVEQLRHAFNPVLGARPGGRYYSEEVTVMAAMLSAGAEGWWVPSARVEHCIPRERMTLDYIRTYYTRSGRTDIYLNWNSAAVSGRWFLGRPLWVWRLLVQAEIAYWLLQPFVSNERWLRALRARSVAWGRFDEAGQLSAAANARR